MEFDPTIVSYQQLLAAFWHGHDATYPGYSMQYRSAIFYTSDQQRNLATVSKQAEESNMGKTLYTAIIPYTRFYVAENYHQKYYLRQRPDVVDALYAIYPDPADFRDSTTVARLNGYIAGFGNVDTLEKNLDTLGLSSSGKQALLEIARFGLLPACPSTTP